MRDPRELGCRCDECPLAKEGIPVFPEPPKGKIQLLVVGEGPGRKEEIFGRPFVGPSGALLDQVCGEAGIRRQDLYLTNACLCRAESDQDLAKAAACCAPRLLSELTQSDVPILALGKAAAKSVLGVSSIQLTRGFVWKMPDVRKKLKATKRANVVKRAELEQRQALRGRTVFPTVHPAFVLRSDAWRPIFALDIKRVARWTKGEL